MDEYLEWRKVRAEFRRQRMDSGLTHFEVAEMLGWRLSKLLRMEQSSRPMDRESIAILEALYEGLK